MSTQEMIKVIDEQLSSLPEKVVQEVYAMVNEATKTINNKLLRETDALDKIFDRYDDVFKKLAQ